jgi:hypothetical protein
MLAGFTSALPQEEVMYLKELSRIPVNAAVPLPVMPMSLGPSDALTRARQPGDIGEGAYYAAIRDVVTSVTTPLLSCVKCREMLARQARTLTLPLAVV